jgi:tRNA pseudouridine38-40 synthase
MRYMLTIAYEGTDFRGWQRQEPPPPAEPMRTVQGVLQHAVREAVRQPVDVVGASRTDSGVHAVGQVAAFTAETTIPIDRLAPAISSRLPDDVQVRDARIVRDDFDPISHAIRKTYRYTIVHGGPAGAGRSRQPGSGGVRRGGPHPGPLPEGEGAESESGAGTDAPVHILPPLFDRRIVYFTRHALDAAAMNDAARHFVGEHDFASFAQIDHGRTTTVRTIFACSATALAPDRCVIEVTGSGFLYNMVRIIAGTLVEVGRRERGGRGRIAPSELPGIIAARDRRVAGPTLPPEGLMLMSVEYPPEVLRAG